MINWFPLYKSMMEDSEEFRGLTPTEKVYYFQLISEFNLRQKEFYKADLEFAVMLALSEDKIRRARRKFQYLGFLNIKPGFRSRGKGVATSYLSIRWNKPGEGEFFAQFHRYVFESMLSKVRSGKLKHSDVLIYVYLSYLQWKNRGANDGKFYIAKRLLNELTNVADSTSAVVRLHALYTFTSGAHLFEYKDQYHKIAFDKWTTLADPSEDENNRQIAERNRQSVKDAIATIKRAKKVEDRELLPQGLPGLFEKEASGGYRLGINQQRQLIKMGEVIGVSKVSRAIVTYLGTHNPKTFPYFLKWFEQHG